MVAIEFDPGNGCCGLCDDGAEPRGGPAPVGQAVDLGRQDPAGAPRRSRTPGAGARQELPAGPSRPRRLPGRAGPDRVIAIHADSPRQSRGAGDDPLRPPDPGAGRGRRGSARVARREQGGLRLPALCGGQIRLGVLGARRRHHPSSGAGTVRLPRRADHRHGLAHAERRRSGRLLRRGGRRRRRRGHRRIALGSALPEAHRGLPDRQHGRVDGAQGRHSLCCRPADRLRRDQRHRRIYRPRRAHDQRHRQGNNHQHGRRARRHDLDFPGRRAHGEIPARHRQGWSRPADAAEPASARTGQGGRGGSREILRPCRRARFIETRALCRRSPFARPGAPDLQAGGRGGGPEERVYRRDLDRADRQLYELVL